MSLSPEQLIWAYSRGVFPMARGRTGPIEWFAPDPRAILPLEPGAFHASKSLLRRARSGRYRVTRDRAFEEVVRRCAGPRSTQPDTWINDEIIDAYTRLHHEGMAHSVETWRTSAPDANPDAEPELVGGLYGVAIGGAFFGESMFSTATDASKVCLVHLVEHLRKRGYVLLDVQLQSEHMAQFGTVEVPRVEYERRLGRAIALDVTWDET